VEMSCSEEALMIFFPLNNLYFCTSDVHSVQGHSGVQKSSNKNKIHSFFFHVSCPSYSLIVLRAILSIFP
jgi:hypothetical protein